MQKEERGQKDEQRQREVWSPTPQEDFVRPGGLYLRHPKFFVMLATRGTRY